ncbi:WXG100 family type VII secretion target [Carbonactinospora thermoautotrophica]|uniref:WXG100 family type VII secretion target n=1 Tax=Carbonactinospora thermoautotrophica TaxID=1469144 RepID=UPI003DA8FCC0
MSILLPGELVTVLDLLGFTWPQADEDKLEDCARAWRDFANEVEHVLADADRVVRAVVAENQGASIAAFEDYWPRLGGGSGQLCEAADAARLVAEVLEGFADAVRVAKGLVLAQLGLGRGVAGRRAAVRGGAAGVPAGDPQGPR